jgi:hypothetical protein
MLEIFSQDGAGRAEAIRVAFRAGGVPFEDVRLPYQEILAAKAEGKFSCGLPTLKLPDGREVTQPVVVDNKCHPPSAASTRRTIANTP